MRIKKHPSGNEYIRAAGLYVRNFCKPNVTAIDINSLFSIDDHRIVVDNNLRNQKYQLISDETIRWSNIVIVSDGYDFKKRHRLIEKLPNDVSVIAVNGALSKWEMIDPIVPVNIFLANNPYLESLHDIPKHEYYPACVASTRTNTQFMTKYKGNKFCYEPALDEHFGIDRAAKWNIDDYRNPVCAAIGLAYRFGVKKLMLLCCDESFKDRRDSSVQLKNGLYAYPQHVRSDQIVDANLYWLTHQESNRVKVANYSSGTEYTNTVYISSDEEAVDFFANN